jgi:hypothetical protein
VPCTRLKASFGLRGLLLAALCLGLCAAGCTGKQSESKERETSGLKQLSVMYGRFLSRHRGQPPANEKEFKEFVKSVTAGQPSGPVDVDRLFISNRDNQPYVIIYGPVTGPATPSGGPVFAYEKTGLEGKRFVAATTTAVIEVDEAQFKQLVPKAR